MDTAEDLNNKLGFIRGAKSNYWKQRQEKKLLEIFNLSVGNVKAYPDFLKKAKIDYKKIKNIESFRMLPSVNKDNYLRKYPWEKLCLNGSLAKESLVLTSTSGSTGQPFYFPRNSMLDGQSSVYHRMFLDNSKNDPTKSTLVLVCFGMGVWIGGVITYEAFKTISEHNYPMTILTPGVNKKEIYEALKKVGPKYDQIILCGYPPFMKDVIDEGKKNNVNWRDFNLKIIFAAEAFSEKFREYILKKTGIKNPYLDTMNIYGSADLGTMAQETPISILIRRLALKNPNLYKKLFSESARLPTLAQYIPQFICFESVGKSIYCSGDNILPLVRYEIGDNGGVLYYSEIQDIFKSEGFDLIEEAKKVEIEETIEELPFVYVYERTDFSTKLYGAIIFPEYIKTGLHDQTLEKYITGKFTMYTNLNDKLDEYLEVNVELKPGINESHWLTEEVTRLIFDGLMENSAEYRYLNGTLHDRLQPHVIFWPHEHSVHFKTGIKQKWLKK